MNIVQKMMDNMMPPSTKATIYSVEMFHTETSQDLCDLEPPAVRFLYIYPLY